MSKLKQPTNVSERKYFESVLEPVIDRYSGNTISGCGLVGKKRRSTTALLMALLVGSSCMMPRQVNAWDNDAFVAGAAGISILAGACAAGAWLFGKDSDEVVLHKARASYNNALYHFNAIEAVIKDGYHMDHCAVISASTESLILGTIRQDILVQLARMGDMSSTCRTLRSTRDTLKDHYKELKKRSERSGCHRDMQELAFDIDVLSQRLAFIHHYLRHHETFFNLFAVYNQVTADFATEIQVLSYCQGRVDILGQSELRNIIIRSGGCYPHIQYVEKVACAKNRLARTVQDSAYSYELVPSARLLVQALAMLHDYVRLTPAYTSELNQRERERLEHARLELERERLRLERQRLQEQRLAYQRDIIAREQAIARELAELRVQYEAFPLVVYPTTSLYVPVVAEPTVTLDLNFSIPIF